jgi:hypothetical protein
VLRVILERVDLVVETAYLVWMELRDPEVPMVTMDSQDFQVIRTNPAFDIL